MIKIMDGNDISGAIENEANINIAEQAEHLAHTAERLDDMLDGFCTYPHLAALVNENMEYMDSYEDVRKASMLAAGGDEIGLMKLLKSQQKAKKAKMQLV